MTIKRVFAARVAIDSDYRAAVRGHARRRLPRVAVDDLESRRDAPVAGERGVSRAHPRPAACAGERAAPFCMRVALAGRTQVREQAVQARVGERDQLHVHDRVGEARRDERVAEVVHVEEGMNVRQRVDESRAQLLQRVGPVGREHQQAADREHAMPLADRRAEIRRPGEREVRPDHPARAACQRERGDVPTDDVLARAAEPSAAALGERPRFARALEAPERGVDERELGAGIALAQHGAPRRPAADVQDPRGACLTKARRSRHPALDLARDRVGARAAAARSNQRRAARRSSQPSIGARLALLGRDAELREQRAVRARLRIAGGEELVAVEDRVRAGEEAQRLHRLGHLAAAPRRAARGSLGMVMRAHGDGAHELGPVERGSAPSQRRALHLHELVDRHRFGLRVEARELRDQPGALRARLAHADDAAAAHAACRPRAPARACRAGRRSRAW